MKKIVSVLLITFVISCTAWADPATHAKAAEELLLAVGTDTILEQAIAQQLIIQVQSTPALSPYQNVMQRFLEKHMGWQSLKDDLIRLYTQTFTETEIRDILVFYKTPSGQKMIKKQAELMAQGAQLGVKRVQDNLPELRAMIDTETARSQKKQ